MAYLKTIRKIDIIIFVFNSLTAVCVGMFFNIYTTYLTNTGTPFAFTEVFIKIGWWNMIFVFWPLLGFVSLRYKEKQRISHIGLMASQIRKQLRSFCEGCKFPNKSVIGLNIHLYFYDLQSVDCGNHTKKIVEVLRKNREYYFGFEALPNDRRSDFFKLTDDMEICKSFKGETAIYRKFENHKIDDYSEELHGKIDTRIRWVLAMPIRLPDKISQGVLCCFGHEHLFTEDGEERYYFEEIASNLADAVALVVDAEETLKFYKRPH